MPRHDARRLNMAIDEVGELHERITQLDEYARDLRSESNEIVAFIPGSDGRPEQIVTDPSRFAEIGKELRDVVTARARTVDRLEAVRGLLGHNQDGCLAALSGEGYLNQATRLRFRFANELHPMMVNVRRARTLAEVQELPEYKRLEAETLPAIISLEEKAAQDQALAAQVRAILYS
jgi:hypothetical protein